MPTARRVARIAVRSTVGVTLSLVVLLSAANMFGIVRAATITSGSMRPTLPPGTVVFDHRVSASDVHVGDVITFANPSGSLTTHRVVALRHDGAQLLASTRGDSNNVRDPWTVKLSGDAWRKAFSIPMIGFPLFALRHLNLFRLLAILLPLATAVLMVARIWRADQTEAAVVDA